MNSAQASPEAYRAMAGLERFIRESGIEHSLLHLVKTRASQMNGCAYCIDLHSKDARAEFSEAELMNLTMAVVAINRWSRIAIAFRAVPGTCQPPRVPSPNMAQADAAGVL